MRKYTFSILTAVLVLCFNPGCTHETTYPPVPETDVADDTVVFAVIGDFGYAGDFEDSVASMVKSWKPDFIITTGDNNYPAGEYETLNDNIGQYYEDYIWNFDAPSAFRCTGMASDSSQNRFFPTPGNHDLGNIRGLKPYLDYFSLPGDELYYKIKWGSAAFYSINSLYGLSAQQEWLEKELGKSDKKFNIVFFHHSPYTQGPHGDTKNMQWPFSDWGVDLVLTGHDHIYARIERSDEPGLHYIVTGAGGKSLYTLDQTVHTEAPFSCISTNEDYGAVYGKITENELYLAYYLINHQDSAFDEISILR